MLKDDFDPVLNAARTGAEWAWTAIYRDLAPALLGYFRGQGAADPEDLPGEVFIQIVRHLAAFEGDERDFRAWAFTIAHNRLVDDRRRRRRRPTVELTDVVVERHGPTSDVEAEALTELAEDHVRVLIEGLLPDQRSVLLLRIIGDLTVDQVAQVIGKSPGAVKALQRRGLAAATKKIFSTPVPLQTTSTVTESR